MTDVGYHLGHETQASKVMYLDSRDDVSSGGQTGSEFTVVFEDTLTTRDDEGVLVSLLSATIPYSFYNIRAGVNDALSFVEATLDGGTSHTHAVALEPGNYTATTLRTALADKATAVCAASGISTVIAIDYDRTQQKLKFSTATADRRVTLLFQSVASTMHTELGFPGTSDPEFTSSSTLTSQNVVDINGSIHARTPLALPIYSGSDCT